MNDPQVISDFQRAISHLAGKTCRYSTGPAIGSRFYLDFGAEQIKEHVSEESRRTEKQHACGDVMSLGVGCAAWRLDGTEGPITGSTDDNSVDGPMYRGLEELVGEVVAEVVVSPPSWDLTITFHNGKALKVFCDQLSGGGNYVFLDEGIYFVVHSGGRLTTEACQ